VRPRNRRRKSATLSPVESFDDSVDGGEALDGRYSIPCDSSNAIRRAFSACNLESKSSDTGFSTEILRHHINAEIATEFTCTQATLPAE
jgi:hypothetical protein